MSGNSVNIFRKLESDNTLAERLEKFLEENRNEDPLALRLRLIDNTLPDDEREFLDFALLQLEARKKYSLKFSGIPSILFPSMLAAEQASNAGVALFHASLAEGEKSLLDLSAGMGVDFMTMSKSISADGSDCVAVEIEGNKCDCLRLNLKKRGLIKSEVLEGDSIRRLKDMIEAGRRFGVIFIDPSRRDSGGGRIYDPKKCEPDIISNRKFLFEVSDRVMIKNSPMLDVSMAMKTFPDATDIYVVSVRNECKEVLIDSREGGNLERVHSVDILSDGSIQRIDVHPDQIGESYDREYISVDELEEALEQNTLYMYEPSVSLMKLGAWNFLADKFNMKKSSPNSHIFFSRQLIDHFPGRILHVKSILDRKSLKGLKGLPRNVVTRNYPLKSSPLSRKLKVNSGNDKFIYGLTISENEKPLLLDTVMI